MQKNFTRLLFFVLCSTTAISAVLIACYEGENAAEARVAVEKLAQYLTEAGY